MDVQQHHLDGTSGILRTNVLGVFAALSICAESNINRAPVAVLCSLTLGGNESEVVSQCCASQRLRATSFLTASSGTTIFPGPTSCANGNRNRLRVHSHGSASRYVPLHSKHTFYFLIDLMVIIVRTQDNLSRRDIFLSVLLCAANECILFTAGERPFLCLLCNKPFKLKHHRKNHILTQHREGGHTLPFVYRCTICGKPQKSNRTKSTSHFLVHQH